MIALNTNREGLCDSLGLSGFRWSRALRWGLAAWMLLAVALAAKNWLSPVAHTCFPCYRDAGQAWWAGNDLYYLSPTMVTTFRYTPTFAIAIAPWAACPQPLGGVLWGVTLVATAAAALAILARELPLPGVVANHRDWLLLLALPGSVRGLWSGQCNSLVLALVALAAVAIHGRRGWWAAGLLAAAVFVKPWALVAAVIFVVLWPRLLAPRLCVAMAALAALPFLTARPQYVIEQYSSLWRVLTGPCTEHWPGFRDMWRTWEVMVGPVDVTIYRSIQVFTALGLVAALVAYARRAPSISHTLWMAMGGWCAWQLLFGFTTERNTYGLAAPILAWMLLASRRRVQLWPAVLAAVALLIVGSGKLERSFGQQLPIVIAAMPLAVVAVAVWLCQMALITLRKPRLVAAASDYYVETMRVSGVQHAQIHRAAGRSSADATTKRLTLPVISAIPAVQAQDHSTTSESSQAVV